MSSLGNIAKFVVVFLFKPKEYFNYSVKTLAKEEPKLPSRLWVNIMPYKWLQLSRDFLIISKVFYTSISLLEKIC